MLRGEGSLPADLARLLHEPPPDGVWYVPGHPPRVVKHRFVQFVLRALRTVTGRTQPSDDEDEDNGKRFGLWLTDDHVLLVDSRGPRAARREDVVSLRVHRVGRRREDLLVFKLRQGRLRFPIAWLGDWVGRAGALRTEVDRRQREWRERDRTPAKQGSG